MRKKNKSSYKKNPKIKAKSKHKSKDVKEQKKPISISNFFIKLIVLLIIVFVCIYYSDKKGYFNPDMTNNHTIKKWDAFYNFSKRDNVDILLVGNSHLYTGINPKNLSITLGANSFILASPGTSIGDTYWGLKEAIKKYDIKLVVVETYGINNFNQYELKDGSLSDQFKSFSARKNLLMKLVSTPYLFTPGNYHFAWSNTIRNHNFIFDNYEQISNNIQLAKNYRKDNELYLGRYVRFTTGLQDSILNLYEEKGAKVKGLDYSYSRHAEHYITKIVELCEKNNIELIFLTLPMYEKHIDNYEFWSEELNKILIVKHPDKCNWFDMQKKENYEKIGFDIHSFENTYNGNQHMTYSGSLLATYSLASYIRDSLNLSLPNRETELRWHNIFYGEEGYFEHFSPNENDKEIKIIVRNKKIYNTELQEVLIVPSNQSNMIMAKVSKKNLSEIDYKNKGLRLLIEVAENNEPQRAVLELKYDNFHSPEMHAIYTQYLRKDIEDIQIIDGVIE